MLNRSIPLVVCLSAVAGVTVAQSIQGNGYVTEIASATSTAGQFQGFLYNVASIGSPTFSNSGPAATSQIVGKPDGSKFYVLGAGGLQTFDPTFTTPKTVNGLSGTLTQAVMSPDGRYLLVASSQSPGASVVYVLNTTSDTISLTQTVTGTIPGGSSPGALGSSTPTPGAFGIVISRDSSTAYILTSTNVTQIIVLNLNTLQELGRAPILLENPRTGDTYGGHPQAFAYSPQGLLYITAGNQILELTPSNLQTCLASPSTCNPVTNVVAVNGTMGPPQFTPDGTMAFFVNLTTATGGQSLVSMALPSHTLNTFSTGGSSGGIEQFDQITVAGNNRLFAHSIPDNTLWDVTPDFSTVAPSALSGTGAPVTGVFSMVVSNELPSARYLFTAVNNGGSLSTLYRFDLTTNTVTSQASLSLGLGTLSFIYIPQSAGACTAGTTTSPCYTFVTYNASQTVAASTQAAPLIARVLDQAGRPVFAVPVSWSGDMSLTFDPSDSTQTNFDGYVQALVTVGANGGSFPVTLTAGNGSSASTATFALTVPGAGGGCAGSSCPGGGTSQMTIIAGNGGLYTTNQFNNFNPLTVQVTDTGGNPLANVAVSFMVTGPLVGEVNVPNATTDSNGLASTYFIGEFLQQFTAFEATTVTASSIYGSVNFTETVFQYNPDLTGGVQATGGLVNSSGSITIGEGDTAMNAIQTSIFAESFGAGQPIPNLSLTLVDTSTNMLSSAATCQGNPMTDATGTALCNIVVSCSAGVGNVYSIYPTVGATQYRPSFTLVVAPGSTQTIRAQSGNNQSGTGGTALSIPLVVAVTDKCGATIPGIPITWKVTQGSATLSATSTTSNVNGLSTVRVTLGTTPGPIQITASIAGGASVVFSATVQATPGSLTLISGNNQTAQLSQPFGQALVFQVKDTSNNPIPNQTVNFSATGPVVLSATSGTTNAQGQASVSVTAQAVAGTVTVTATYSTFTATATLTVITPGPAISSTSFTNAASGATGLAPCGLATVKGSGLATSVTGVVVGNPLGIGPLPYTLSGVTITVGGVPAPILSVSNVNGTQQVNFQAPCETPVSPATVIVQVGSVSTTVTNVSVFPAQPGMFTYAGPSGQNYGWIISATDGSYLTPSNLAHVGSTYYLVATGLGQTTPPVTTNAAGTGTQTIPVANIVLAIGSTSVTVNSAAYLQGAVGEYLIQFTIPSVVNGQPFPTGNNLPMSLGVVAGGQTIFDTEAVAIPGIH